MAKDFTHHARPADPVPEKQSPDPALTFDQDRQWLRSLLAEAERTERVGPGGSWQHNEGKRESIIKHAAFLRALVKLLPE